MIIRNDQIDILAKAAETRYVVRAADHLERFDPPLAKSAGRASLEKAALQGLASARQYGFTEDRALQLYLELMMTLGSGFDSDPMLGWLHPFLQADSGSAAERARLIHFHVLAYLERAFGRSREHGRAGLQRAATLTLDRLSTLGLDIDAQVMRLVEWLQPQRIDFLDSAALEELLAGARKEATHYRLPSGEGTVVVFMLKFAFGHKVLSDPLYEWIEKPLNAEGANEPAVRLERYCNYLRRAITQMDREFGGTPT